MFDTKIQVDPASTEGAHANLVAVVKSLLAKLLAMGPARSAAPGAMVEVNKTLETLQSAIAGMCTSLPQVPVREVNMSANSDRLTKVESRESQRGNVPTKKAIELMNSR